MRYHIVFFHLPHFLLVLQTLMTSSNASNIVNIQNTSIILKSKFSSHIFNIYLWEYLRQHKSDFAPKIYFVLFFPIANTNSPHLPNCFYPLSRIIYPCSSSDERPGYSYFCTFYKQGTNYLLSETISRIFV